MKLLVLLSSVSIYCSGCAEMILDEVQRTRRADDFRQKMASEKPRPVIIESDPPGAVIEIENDVRGRTPCTIYLNALPDGTLWGGVEITALPTQAGDFVQRKLLRGGWPLPQHIFFNMHLGPPTPQIDVHVDE